MQLVVLTPEKEWFSGEVSSVILPGIQGGFQILENHAPLVSALTTGTVAVVTKLGEDKQFNIERGFIEVLNNKVSLLVQAIGETE